MSQNPNAAKPPASLVSRGPGLRAQTPAVANAQTTTATGYTPPKPVLQEHKVEELNLANAATDSDAAPYTPIPYDPTAHHTLIIGCGTDGRLAAHGCKPQTGNHDLRCYTQYAALLPESIRTRLPAPAGPYDDGKILTTDCFTVDPVEAARPHMAAKFLDDGFGVFAAQHQGAFDLVYWDHAGGFAGEAMEADYPFRVIERALGLLRPGGLLVLSALAVPQVRPMAGGAWRFDQENKSARGDAESENAFVEKAPGGLQGKIRECVPFHTEVHDMASEQKQYTILVGLAMRKA
ncbi:hypothetical protein CONLIGDRAFT_626974 [Coniochaeta ligniaria NRRL 30616]|uniref:S-adenosyl-L-methionine-dependent methyltransferase n=1 Tax=Coniochaeta ligniaria NRRL 30616 TaxID=1408157 RepID=A0A1J7JZQ6_9PEZI|nr:hypothetical protein CONLIGDRAFT_626974 [Coniochaeta ligniaria NRRL 30616]